MQYFRQIVAAVLLVASATAMGQAHHHGGGMESDYAELKSRDIKALSNTQIEDLRAGAGMGLSLPAELNNAPGPKHALEMASDLNLSADQKQKLTLVIAEMLVQATKFGNEIIDEERKLDRAFASRSADAVFVQTEAERIGLLNGKLRAVHLKAHLEATRILTAPQIARYQEIRGYK